MNKLLKNPTYQSNHGYNGLDMSSVTDFSSTVGHILPVQWDFLQPGDKVKIGSFLRTRTQPLISAAMCDIEEHVQTFFVPISQLYKPFEQLFNGIQDYGSDFYSPIIAGNDGTLTDYLPAFRLGTLYDMLTEMYNNGDESKLYYNACRFLEHLGVPILQLLKEDVNVTSNTARAHSVNLFPILAYHKIWSDFFRDTDRIANDPSLYNMDSYVSSDKALPDVAKLRQLLKLHTCPVQKDGMNNIQTSPIFGESGINGDSLTTLKQVNQWLTNNSVDTVSPATNQIPIQNTSNPTTVALKGNNSQSIATAAYWSAISPANLRSIFATEKLLEITRRAKKHYDAQILAHFGVDVPTGVDGECFEVGHHVQNLVIGDVVSTAATSDASLGEIGGKGYSSDKSRSFMFEAKTHGVLMTVYYARPRFVYFPTGLDKKLLYAKVSDFPRQEYENLGQQPVFVLNQYLTAESASNSVICGWQWRYSECKIAHDRAITGLARTLKNWVVGKNPVYKNADTFYVEPTAINEIMEIPYDDSHFISTEQTDVNKAQAAENVSMFDTDPMIHQLNIDYQKASKISTYGIQKL